MNRRPVHAASVALALGVLLGACGSDSEPESSVRSQTPSSAASSPSDTPSASISGSPTEPTGTTVNATIRGDNISPGAEKVKVARGEEITLDLVSDREGELHVHSTPEKEIAFGPGRTTATLTFDRPGLVDVEEHESHQLLVQFEVR